MEAFRQDVDQEAADELVCRECHELVPLGTLDPVVLVFEPDAHRVSRDQAAIGDGDAMRVAREVRENGIGSAELHAAGFDVQPWTLHDLRRTFATNMASLGTPIHVTETLLHHVSGTTSGIVGVYQRHAYMDEMRQAI